MEDGKSISATVEIHCDEAFSGARLELDLPSGDLLSGDPPAGLTRRGSPVVDTAEKMARYSFSVDAAVARSFSFQILPTTVGDHRIYIRVLAPQENGDVWGDEYAFFYHFDGKKSTEGYRLLDRQHETPAIRTASDPTQACPGLPKRPASVALPPGTSSPAMPALAPAGTISVSGRWMMYDENDNHIPQWEQLCELVDGAGTHLGWTYTNMDGYFTFGAVTNPPSFNVRVYTQTYYNRTGGTDRVWVRNAAGDVYYTYSDTYNAVPDGPYNIGEWSTPNGSTYEKGYWAVKKMQDAWRYILFIGVADTYAGPLELEWYPGSTDGTYYRLSEKRVHLKDNDPRGSYTTVHECGHSIMHFAYGNYFPVNDCPSPHYINRVGGTNCGWTEGFADFLPLPVYNTTTLSWPDGSSVDFEAPSWTTANWDDGVTCEGRVAGALWDILDSVNEADNDFYTDSPYGIWQTIWNVNSDTFCSFWDSTRSYGVPRSRDNCLYQNTIDTCGTCVEDPYENDDTCATALLEGVPSTYTYEHCTDADWQNVNAQLDWQYTWETNDLGYAGDTSLTLYAADCATQLGYNNDKNSGNWPLASRLVWTSDRTARVNLVCREFGAYGAHKSYDISLSRSCPNVNAATSLTPASGATACSSSQTLSWTGFGRTYDVHLDGAVQCPDTSSTSCAVSGLASEWHSWYVTSKNACGDTTNTFTYWFYVASAPVTSATAASDADLCADTGVTITWAAPTWNDNGSGTRSFSIYRSDAVYVATGLSEATISFTDTTGTNDTNYNYWVRAINGCGTGTWYSASASAADKLGTAPSSSSTTAADANACADTGVMINWTAPAAWGDNGSGTRSFSVYRNDGVYVATSLSALTTGFTDTTGTNGVNYTYWIRAINGCGLGIWYAVSAAAADIVPSAPSSSSTTAVDVSACGDTGVAITWAAPATWGDNGSGTRSFTVYRNDFVDVATGLAASTTSFTDTTGVNGTSYLYYVRAINGCGNWTWYSASANTADLVGATPTAMSTSAVDSSPTLDTGVDISWSAPTVWGDNTYNASGRSYRVYRGALLIGTFGTSTLAMNDNGGTNGVGYTYSVQAMNGCGYSVAYASQAASDTVVFNAGEASKAGSPMRAVKGSGTSVSLTYTAASCATNHAVYWGSASGTIPGNLTWTGAACALGISSPAILDPGEPPAGNFFYFVIVGTNGWTEGSYGIGSNLVERPEATGLACDPPQDLTGACS